MATTFRSGPRDPRTGATSTVISPGNIVRADGRTDNERSQMASQFTADPGQEQSYRQAERDYQEFLQSSGRSSTNPFGDAGVFGGGVNFSGIMTPRQIEDVNRLAYNQYLGLVSGRGTQRCGIGDFIPGYAPALKIGSNTPRGRVVAAPTQPKQGGIFSLSPTLGILRNLFGRGNISRTLDDGGIDYSAEGIETLDVSPPEKTTPGYDTLAGENLFNLGPFVQVAQQDSEAFAQAQALADQDRIQLEYPEGVERRSLYEGLAAPGTGLRLEDLVGPNKVADLSDLSDSANLGNPYAGTTGAFVPRRIEITPDGKLIEVPVGFDKGGEVPAGEGLFSKEELARQDRIASAEPQPDGSMPDVDSLRFATQEEVDMGSYKHLQHLQDKFNYHMKAAQSPVTTIAGFLPFQANPANRVAHAEDAEMYRGMIEDFKDKRARAIVNYEAYIQAGGMPLYVNTEKGAYFSGFPDALVNFKATNP